MENYFLTLFLVRDLATGAHGLSRIAATRSRIGFCSLTARWKTFLMSCAAIAFDIFETFDVSCDFAFQIAFDFH